ncbi:hypothetical protein [Segatella oulorum]|uniref:hypothetical protein n=1 Tax=Segatella oulorum TaxID=28136 RepID=UPI0028E9326A|nr:hypothetical protein [Segatella oulorum]
MQWQRCSYDAYAGYAQRHLGHHHFSCCYDARSVAKMRSGEASAQPAARDINLSA